jgi:hypothetical protein
VAVTGPSACFRVGLRVSEGVVLPGPLQVGDLLAGRYELLDPVATDGPAVLWRAHDEVLARDVAVRVLPTPNKESRKQVAPFLSAAARAGAVSHPGLVRVYDAAEEPGPRRGTDVVYLIREWVEGEPLDEHLARVGELAAPDAADLLRQLADALTAAHTSGLPHGRVHPGNVLITPSGRVRVTDAAVASAVHGDEVTDPLDDVAVWRDTRDAAAVLYALLTTRWPASSTPQPGGSLAAAPLSQGHAVGPHQVRASVSRHLDHVVLRALDPGQVPMLPPLRTPQALADAADHEAEAARRERQSVSARREPGWVRRHAGVLMALGLVLALGGLGWFAGLAVGTLERRPDAVDALVASPAPGTSGASPAPALDLRNAPLRDFDPLGDKQENPDQVRNAVDLDPTTAWVTQRYRTAKFSGLKDGVGLLVDLGSPRDLRRVRVAFTSPGAHVELRVTNVAPSTLDATREVASDDSGAQVANLVPRAPTRVRYVLIWITELPKADEGYRVGISEVAVS